VPDYSPVFLPGLTITLQAADNITGGDPLEVAGSGTCQKAAAGSLKYIGVANKDAAAGYAVTLTAASPVFDGPADGAILAGDQLVASGRTGCQVTGAPIVPADPGQADMITSRAIIGVALTTAVDGGTVRWMQR
jgi:hypothetical protein